MSQGMTSATRRSQNSLAGVSNHSNEGTRTEHSTENEQNLGNRGALYEQDQTGLRQDGTNHAGPQVGPGGVTIHHPMIAPKDDPLKHDAAYVANEKAGIIKGDVEHAGGYDEEDDMIARAINSIVPQTDDPTEPAFTFRVMLLGTLWGVALCACNRFVFLTACDSIPNRSTLTFVVISIFAFRTVPFTISATVVTLLAYPMGTFMARFLPRANFNAFGHSWGLNPGPFRMKEHVLISLIASSAGSISYGMDNLAAQMISGNQDITFGQGIGWILCIQMIGLGLAGVLRRFVIWPREMIWPGNFSTLALYASYWQEDNALAAEGAAKYKWSRYKMFWVALFAMFVWEWFPLFIFPALQAVSLLCWFSKKPSAKNFGSAFTGHGAISFTFDWTLVTSGVMTTPFWVTCLMFSGNIFFCWICPSILNAVGAAGSNNLGANGEVAINSSSMFDASGAAVNAKKFYITIPNGGGLAVNHTFIEAHGPFTITTQFYMAYAAGFFNLAATLSHIFLWYGPQIMRQTRQMLKGEGREGEDVHNRLMKAYPEVPEWIYGIFLVVFFVGMIIVGKYTPFVLPAWSVIVAALISFVFTLPIAIIQSITGQQIGLNIVSEMVAGYAMPGNLVAVMCFKSFCYNIMIQATALLADLKIGHYLHIAPASMFWTQVYGNFLGVFVATGINIPLINAWGPNGSNKIKAGDPFWGNNSYGLFFNAGGIWGALGPKALFGDAYHNMIMLAFLFGFILPVVPWALNKWHPSRWWIYCNFAIFSIQYSLAQTGYTQSWLWTGWIIAFVFQFLIYRNKFAWWSKYNYVLGAGFDSGLVLATLVTLAVQNYVAFPLWAGNPISSGHLDYYCDGVDYLGN
ncbi:hypothetical protein HKX48_009009 [Thoreauomyces humboldtii]|nr:hypothetical protein HKX48_009009 [Thoreauomyces humboldtii]